MSGRTATRLVAAVTVVASPVVMSLGQVGVVVGLAALLGGLLTLAGVELRAAWAREDRS